MRPTTELSNEQIQKYAPSAFAGQAYHDRSDKYAFIPTVNVIDGMREAGFVPVQASQSRTRIAEKSFFTKHMIRFRATASLGAQAVVGDSILEAVLINSHDGTSAYKLYAGVFRFVCTNGMVVSDALIGSIHLRHTGNVIREAVEGTQHLFEQAPKVMEAVQEWQALQLNPAEQLALAEGAHALRFENANTAVTPAMLLNARRYDDQANDLWHTYNRVQENTIRGLSSRFVRRASENREARGSRAVRGIDQDVKLNRQLWALGEKMVAIKAGR